MSPQNIVPAAGFTEVSGSGLQIGLFHWTVKNVKIYRVSRRRLQPWLLRRLICFSLATVAMRTPQQTMSGSRFGSSRPLG
jgi:hypothetical protein